MPDRVGLVIVSHSTEIAHGVARLVTQTAPDVVVVAAGGRSEDPRDLGTSFDRVSRALADADGGAGAVVLTDLGSAVLTSESALELLDDAIQERIRIADAPLVEGAVAAGVAAQTGGRVDDVLAEAERAAGGREAVEREPVARQASSAPPGGPASASGEPAGVRRTVEVRADQGLHARPAAELVRLAAGFDVSVTVNGADARSLLAIMALGVRSGERVEIAAGDGGRSAVDAIADLLERGA